MGETNSSSVAHMGYDISPLSRVKCRNPRTTEGEYIHSPDKLCTYIFIASGYFSP